MKFNILCFYLFLFISILHADGLRYNEEKTHLMGDVVILSLSKLQQQQVSRTRILDLSKEQITLIQSKKVKCPTRIEILTNRYDDCTCGMGPIGVWFRVDEIEIPIEYYLAETDSESEINEEINIYELVLDYDLNLWFFGEEVTQIKFWKKVNALAKTVTPKLRKLSGAAYTIFVGTPPFLKPNKEKKLFELVKRMTKQAETNEEKIELYFSGFPEFYLEQ